MEKRFLLTVALLRPFSFLVEVIGRFFISGAGKSLISEDVEAHRDLHE